MVRNAEERLREPALLSLKKEQLQGDPPAASCKEVIEKALHSSAQWEYKREQAQIGTGELQTTCRRRFFTMRIQRCITRMVKHWSRLPREVV